MKRVYLRWVTNEEYTELDNLFAELKAKETIKELEKVEEQ